MGQLVVVADQHFFYSEEALKLNWGGLTLQNIREVFGLFFQTKEMEVELKTLANENSEKAALIRITGSE